MKPTNSKISISGLKLSRESYFEIDELLRNLERYTPLGSNLRLNIVNGENEVNGFLEVLSTSFKFEASSCGSIPINVVKDVISLLRSQITLWMSQREFS